MGLNLKHIFKHNGATEYDGNAAGNLAIGQGGVDVLTNQNDIIIAGSNSSIVGGVSNADTTDVKQWISITALGDSDAKELVAVVQFKRGISTYTNVELNIPIGATLHGPFYSIKHNDSVTNNEALYCVRG